MRDLLLLYMYIGIFMHCVVTPHGECTNALNLMVSGKKFKKFSACASYILPIYEHNLIIPGQGDFG